MRSRALTLALLTSAPLAACDTVVVLGTDCPPLRGTCPAPDADAPEDDADTPDPDAGVPRSDAGTDDPDASEEGGADAEVDSGPGIFPDLQNVSFELSDGGSEGALPALMMPSPIAPWYACRTGLSVASSVRAGATNVTPQAGSTFLGDSFPIVALNINGLNQDLDPPLKAGQRYAFMVDLWAEGGRTSVLELEVLSAVGCLLPLTHLASSGALPNGSWQSRCMRFKPERDVSTLVLMVIAPEEYVNIGARLYVDNIRSDPECQ
jgi:hypothetical protein